MRSKALKKVLKCNILKTIRFNFRMLPFEKAVKLPFLFFGKVDFRSLKGRVEIEGPVSTGMVLIGEKDVYADTAVQNTIWIINGTFIIHGPLKFFRGSYLLVARDAVLDIGSGGTIFGSHFKAFCFDHITIGENVRVAWDCQVYDTSFHYVEPVDQDNAVKPLTKPVVIGSRVWLGNRSTVAKGAVLPDDTIVASGSLVNKDFSQTAPYCMLAGSPAEVKATGIRRVYDRKTERELDKKFNYPRTGL